MELTPEQEKLVEKRIAEAVENNTKEKNKQFEDFKKSQKNVVDKVKKESEKTKGRSAST